MGTINYFTSNYITLGVNCNDIENDDDFLQEDYEQIESILNSENFYYFSVRIRPGYYEGFSINIDFNFYHCLDSWKDRHEAQKEITRIYKFLLRCVNDFSLVACSPGWCTSYYDYKTTLKRLKESVKEMRDTVNSAPTWAQLRRAGEV